MFRPTLILVLLVLLLGSALPTLAQDNEPAACSPDSGTVITREINSAALGDHIKNYSVYLPPNWCTLDDLPLLVMLHGWSGDNRDWVEWGHLDDTATDLILAGEIKPLVILMPDGDNSFYVNSYEGDYETYIVDELVSAVDTEFPTAATRESRSIGGLSMGGFGALYLGLHYSDMFSAIGIHSPALLTQEEDAPPYLYGYDQELFDQNNPSRIIALEGWPDDMRFWIDTGTNDVWKNGVYDLIPVLLDEHIAYEMHVWPGVHDWSYWGGHAADYLRFYAGIE